MKKLLLIAVFAICGLGTVNAQGFSAGLNLGLPAGDASNTTSFALGADVNYMFNAGESFTYGAATGYQHFLGKSIAGVNVGSTSYIPLAGVARYALSDDFSVGLDLGVAFLSGNGSGTGTYYRPMVVYNLSDTMKLNASYAGVSVVGGTFANFGVGVMFAL
jgi:hypothetical protein